MDIGLMFGVDSVGYVGFNDQVNNYYFWLFVLVFFMFGVMVGIIMSQNQDQQNNGNWQMVSGVFSEVLGQQFGFVIVQLIFKNMNIVLIFEICLGYCFNVIVIKDMMFFKLYQVFDY